MMHLSCFFPLFERNTFIFRQKGKNLKHPSEKSEKKKKNTPSGCKYVCCDARQMNSPCSPLDKLIVIPAVKVMKSPLLHRAVFDLPCQHTGNTTCHQSSLQPKEPQLAFDPSPLLPLRKVGALNFGRLTAFLKSAWGGGFWVTDIWDGGQGWQWGC